MAGDTIGEEGFLGNDIDLVILKKQIFDVRVKIVYTRRAFIYKEFDVGIKKKVNKTRDNTKLRTRISANCP